MVKGPPERRKHAHKPRHSLGKPSEKWCRWCRTFKNSRGFGTHEPACRKRNSQQIEPEDNLEPSEPARKRRKLETTAASQVC